MDQETTWSTAHRVAGRVWRSCSVAGALLLATVLAAVLGESILPEGVFAWLDQWSALALILLGSVTLVGLIAYWTWCCQREAHGDRDVSVEMVVATMRMTDEELTQAIDALGQSHRQLVGEGRLAEAAQVDADRARCLLALANRDHSRSQEGRAS